uniref:uncharacterized protein LOC101310015 n=1 Tax=Fragaria vesca subsp. vesca TaxID=101020 RepID=UPI0005CA968C|nr:PREDICTED: uncharacterized protein LOC101310015 [Fragaria vesca subsp. vesca]
MELGSLLPLNFMQDNIAQEREYDSDDLNSLVNSDDEEQGMTKNPKCNAATDMENPVFVIGMLFATKNDVKEAIKEYSIKGGYETTIKKNDRIRIIAESGNIKIKHVTYKYIAKKWLDRFRDDSKLSLKTLKLTVRREIEVDVSHGQCSRGRQEAIRMVEGSYKEQYSRIWEYCAEVRQTNINSSMIVRANPPYFQRLYVCLEACKNGFKRGCRPIIGVDGCHLKGAFAGQLLAAVGIDANYNMYPIAYAVVESEDKETWCWFLQLLIEDLGLGLDEAFKIVVPMANHRWCVRHLYENFKKLHKGKALKDLLWSAARAPNNAKFETEMMKLKKLSKAAYNWLIGKDPRRWARCRFTSRLKCDMLLNNLCETLNSWILTARDQPILTMLEMIRCNLMRRYQDSGLVSWVIPSMVIEEENASLTSVPLPDEFWGAVKSMDLDSAPVLDGFNGLIILIPKVDHADSIKQFRLIALTNFVFKIIPKILAPRLS